jgi:hypothetical protein
MSCQQRKTGHAPSKGVLFMPPRGIPSLVLVSSSALLIGCAMSGNYQSARTLEKGTSNFGLTFSINTIIQDSSSVTLPNIIPELDFHTGITPDLELGGRISVGAMGIEGDVKYRFFHNDNVHLAVAPAVSYQGLVAVSGTALRVPLIATFDLSERFALNTALFGSYTHYTANKIEGEDYFSAMLGDIGVFGFSAGPEIRGEVFYIRPMVEVSYHRPFNEGSESAMSDFSMVGVIVNFGWVLGREKRQLDRIEEKIDRMKK